MSSDGGIPCSKSVVSDFVYRTPFLMGEVKYFCHKHSFLSFHGKTTGITNEKLDKHSEAYISTTPLFTHTLRHQ